LIIDLQAQPSQCDDRSVAKSDRPRKAVGTYGFLDVLRRPSLMFRPPDPSTSQSDIEAIRGGSARVVACFLRGSFAPYPRRLTQGTLVLSASSATWKPYFGFSRRPLNVEVEAKSVTTRPADYREPGVKKGGQAYGAVTVPTFMVVTGSGPSGSLDFVVPSADVPLVTSWLSNDLDARSPDGSGS
jgi:hypothetical protein